jgi:ABC-type glycerol-3-phosphate transport system permease component
MNHAAKDAVRIQNGIGVSLLFIVLLAISLFFLIPFIWTVSSSIRPAGSIYEYSNPLTLRTFVPEKVTMDNFVLIFTKYDFGRAIFNTFFVACVSILFGIIVNTMAGFALAKFAFPFKSLIFTIVLITFMIPFESIVIPLYLVVGKTGLLNSYAALILPTVGNGLAIFLFRQFFTEFQNELLEAARVDGTSWFRIYWQILLPLSVPAIVTVIVMLFLFQWNALLWPLVAAHSNKYQVVQVAVASNITTEETHWATLFSSAVAASLPPMILFLFLQRYYVQGITQTGLK